MLEPDELWRPLTDPHTVQVAANFLLPARYFLDLEGLPLRELLTFVQEIGQTVRAETKLAPAIGLAANWLSLRTRS